MNDAAPPRPEPPGGPASAQAKPALQGILTPYAGMRETTESIQVLTDARNRVAMVEIGGNPRAPGSW